MNGRSADQDCKGFFADWNRDWIGAALGHLGCRCGALGPSMGYPLRAEIDMRAITGEQRLFPQEQSAA